VAALREHRRWQFEERLAVGPQSGTRGWCSPGRTAGRDTRTVLPKIVGHANIAITMDTCSHVLPGLDEQAAGTVARLILGKPRHQKPSDDKGLTRGRRAARRRREMKGEAPGRRWGDRGGLEPPTFGTTTPRRLSRVILTRLTSTL
jgi:hypothetical protein